MTAARLWSLFLGVPLWFNRQVDVFHWAWIVFIPDWNVVWLWEKRKI